MKKHVGCRLLVLLGAPHHAIIFTDHPLPLNAMRNLPWALLRLMQGLSFVCNCILSKAHGSSAVSKQASKQAGVKKHVLETHTRHMLVIIADSAAGYSVRLALCMRVAWP